MTEPKRIKNWPPPWYPIPNIEPPQWYPADEVEFVQKLGMGRWSQGSDLRHNRKWWLDQYLRVTDGMVEDYHLAGRAEAKRLLVFVDPEFRQ